MAHTQQDQVQQFVNSLRQLKVSASSLLKHAPSIHDKVAVELTRLDNFLCHVSGIAAVEQPRRKFGPIVMPKREQTDQNEVKSAQDMEHDQLQHEVDEIFSAFAERNPDELLDVLTDLQVRGVAIKAGMSKVTEEDPERITLAFIKEIQELIKGTRQKEDTIAWGQRTIEAEQKGNVSIIESTLVGSETTTITKKGKR